MNDFRVILLDNYKRLFGVLEPWDMDGDIPMLSDW